MKDGEVDKEQMCKMVDTFLEQGFNYFDTAHGYLNGKSELALCDCLTSRHERSEYILTNKLTNFYFKSEEEIRPFFESQLKACGVDYFDFYLMHAQSEEIFKYFKKCHAYEIALQLSPSIITIPTLFGYIVSFTIPFLFIIACKLVLYL